MSFGLLDPAKRLGLRERALQPLFIRFYTSFAHALRPYQMGPMTSSDPLTQEVQRAV